MKIRYMCIIGVLGALACGSAAAQTVVSTGVVLRGVTVPGAGVAGQPVNPGRTCDFSDEEVNQTGRMTGASVQCRAGGNVGNTINGMPVRFNAYCVVANAGTLNGRLITAGIPGNANHCDLSAMTPAAATTAFGGAIWR